MKIAEQHSHLNGFEFLLVHKPKLWEEIYEVIINVDAEACKTMVFKEKTKKGQLLYSTKDMNRAFKELLEYKKWSGRSCWETKDELLRRKIEEQKKEIVKTGDTPIFSYNQTDFIKERVAVEVRFGKNYFVAYDIFAKHLASYVSDKIDVGIEILPMKSLQAQMSSGPSYYEGELYNVIRQGRGVPSVPLVLIGIEP